MELIIALYNEALYRPLFNLLILIYNIIPGHDFGVAIILLTLLLRIVLYPLSHKALKSQKAIQELQPKIKEIQRKYKDKEEKARATMAFYKEHKVSPFSGCLPMLVQLPLLIALYQVFLKGFNPENLDALYFFVHNPEIINPMFFGIVNLANPSPIFAILAGFAQFLQSKVTFKQGKGAGLAGGAPDFSKIMSSQMTYIMPLFMVFIAWRFPSGLALYWIITMLFSFGQQLVVNRSFRKSGFLKEGIPPSSARPTSE